MTGVERHVLDLVRTSSPVPVVNSNVFSDESAKTAGSELSVTV